MKWILLLVILLSVFGYVVFRYRRQIQAVREIWKMFRQIQQQAQTGKTEEKVIDKKNRSNGEPLVRCIRCGKWMSESEVVKLGKSTIYCSTDCMEKAVNP